MVKDTRKCTVEECNNIRNAKGFCPKHYYRWKTYGDPLHTRHAAKAKKCSAEECERVVGKHGAKGLCARHYDQMRRKSADSPKCLISGCSKAVQARGWCGTHYARWRNHGDPEYAPPTRYCSIEGCGDKYYVRGWCVMHYQRWRAHGDPHKALFVKYQTPEESFAARTEWQGDCLIWTGTTDEDGYGSIWIDGKMVGVHRFAWERINGKIPGELVIDHKYHCNPACCNVGHLRLATSSQNSWNRAGQRRDSTSGIRNVHKDGPGWRVQIGKAGKTHYFGYYSNIDVAAKIAERARRELFGAFAGKG